LLPEWFQTGEKKGAMAVDFAAADTITWSLTGKSASAGQDATPCALTPDGKGVDLGNGDTFPFDPKGGYVAVAQGQIVASNPTGGNSTPGRTAGTFSVSDDGAARYHVPLWVPPGRTGVQPSLAIDYDSGSGDGLLGHGWRVQGLSKIERCSRDFARDGIPRGVHFDDNDRLCLDGARLVLVSGTYNQKDAEYRTENDQFVKIKQVGRDAKGPTGFLVSLPDGTRQSYGYDPAADGNGNYAGFHGGASSVLEGKQMKVDSGAGTVYPNSYWINYFNTVRLSWAVASWRDRFNNEVSYSYSTVLREHSITGNANDGQGVGQTVKAYEFRPAQITYTNSPSGTADRKVVFEYSGEDEASKRKDVRTSYVGGLGLCSAHLMTKISMYGPATTSSASTPLRSYAISYSNTSRRALITDIQECDGQGVCLPPTHFGWTPMDQTFQRKVIPTDDIGVTQLTFPQPGWLTQIYSSGMFTADVNGDGLDDIVYSEPGLEAGTFTMRGVSSKLVSWSWKWRKAVRTASGSITFSAPSYIYTLHDLPDMPLDGWNPIRGSKYAFSMMSFASRSGWVLDTDGDGRADFMGPQTECPSGPWASYSLWRSTATGFTGGGATACDSNGEPNSGRGDPAGVAGVLRNVYVGDINGDGLPDLLRPRWNTQGQQFYWHTRLNSPTGFGSYVASNGILALPTAEAYVASLDGSSHAQLVYPSFKVCPSGAPDCLTVENNFEANYSFTSLGYDFDSRTLNMDVPTSATFQGPYLHYQLMDVNGDGLPDAVVVPHGGGNVYVTTKDGQQVTHGAVQVAINNGMEFLPPQELLLPANAGVGQAVTLLGDTAPVPGPWEIDNGLRGLDFDLDGRGDLFMMDKGCFNIDASGGDATSTRSSMVTVLSNGEGYPTTAVELGIAPGVESIDYSTATTHFSKTCGGGYGMSRILDANGDGLADFVQVEIETDEFGVQGPRLVLYLRNGPKPDMLQQVTDGLGRTVLVGYSPITDPAAHTPADCKYPQNCRMRGRWLVTTHTMEPFDQAHLMTYTHAYKGGRSDLTGLGWLGMDEHTVTDADNNSTVTTKYDHMTKSDPSGTPGAGIYPFRDRPVERLETYNGKLPDGRPFVTTRDRTFHYTFGHTDYQEAASGKVWQRVYTVPDWDEYVESEKLGSGTAATLRYLKNSYTYNTDYGYVTGTSRIEGKTSDLALTSETMKFYADNPTAWLVGMVQSSTIVSQTAGGSAAARTVGFERDLSSGVLLSMTVEPSSTDPAVYLKISYARDANGQLASVTRTPLSGSSRTDSIVARDPVSGIYPALVTNALGQTTQLVYETGLGLLLRSTDANGLAINRTYDWFGRLRRVRRPDGGGFLRSYEGGITSLAATTAFQILDVEMTNGNALVGGGVERGYDALGRQVYKAQRSGLGNEDFSAAVVAYDNHGRLAQRWRPFLLSAGASLASLPRWEYAYDVLGRMTEEDFVTDAARTLVGQKTWSYGNNTVTRTVHSLTPADGVDQVESTTYDTAGRVAVRQEMSRKPGDASGSPIKLNYYFGPFNRLTEVWRLGTSGATRVAHVEYETRGLRKQLNDPDIGEEKYEYDAYGEMTSATHTATGVVTKYGYDILGRRTTETTSEGVNTMIWDTAANGVGKLAGTSSQDDVTTEYAYDSLRGLPSSATWTIAGEKYSVGYGWDDAGRAKSIQYPAVSGSSYQVTYGYHGASGALYNVVGSDGKELWRADSRNADFNITQETTGNGVQTTRTYGDPWGHLTGLSVISLTSPNIGILESLGYTYNSQGRPWLRANYLNGDAETYTHDSLSRLIKWDGTGPEGTWFVQYAYDDSDGSGSMSSRVDYLNNVVQEVRTFARSGVKCPVTGGPDAVSEVTTNGTLVDCYGYDSRGRQTSGPERTVVFTDFNLPRSVLKGNSSWSFKYDASHSRARKESDGNATVYIGALYEKRIATSDVSHVMYVPGERGTVAQVVQKEGSSFRVVDYLNDDQTHSVISATSSVNSSLKTRFDPFGLRVKNSGPPVSAGGGVPSLDAINLTMGFGGHEHDDDLGLVNMRGRMYDPKIARFLTPDPLVGQPGKTQSWNRYSYANNNPLGMIDPSGFDDEGGGEGEDYDPFDPIEGQCSSGSCASDGSFPDEQVHSDLGDGGDGPGGSDDGKQNFRADTGGRSTGTGGSEVADNGPGSQPAGEAAPDNPPPPAPAGSPEVEVAPPPSPAPTSSSRTQSPFPPGGGGAPSLDLGKVARNRLGPSQYSQQEYAEAKELSDLANKNPGGILLPIAEPPDASFDQNIKLARQHPGDLAWFALQVKPGGPMDYKQYGAQYEEFGNMNYGATGSALGVPEVVLVHAAGAVQILTGTSDRTFGGPLDMGDSSYGDSPKDQFWIHQGVLLYQARAKSP
jgi:RHS repeat-associated protein